MKKATILQSLNKFRALIKAGKKPKINVKRYEEQVEKLE